MDLKNVEKAAEENWYLMDGTMVPESKIGDDVAFKIKMAKPVDMRRLQKKAKRQVYTGRRKQMKDDPVLLTKKLLHFCVKDWRNLKYDGEPYEFSEENLDWLDDNWSAFSSFWQDIVTQDEDIEAVGEEEDLGN